LIIIEIEKISQKILVNIMSKMDYKKANKELRQHIELLLEHFDNDDEMGWIKLMKIAKFVVKVDHE
tara:strand:- start:168 stop:365 length:198 start_codon:yes stop_codon:yes gene_type:complete